MENYQYKQHSFIFNKYYCLVENANNIELYYKNLGEFLKYKFKKIIMNKYKENIIYIINEKDMKYLNDLKTKNEKEFNKIEINSVINTFLKTFFDGVNRFEREQFPCKKTGIMFRTLTLLINCLDEFGPIPDYWLKIKKYCKFKFVDIFKKLNKGEIPKTGGPKENMNKNDEDNNELYLFAKQEKIDLNEIKRSLYNQSMKKVHNLNDDENELQDFIKDDEKINMNQKRNLNKRNMNHKEIPQKIINNFDKLDQKKNILDVSGSFDRANAINSSLMESYIHDNKSIDYFNLLNDDKQHNQILAEKRKRADENLPIIEDDIGENFQILEIARDLKPKFQIYPYDEFEKIKSNASYGQKINRQKSNKSDSIIRKKQKLKDKAKDNSLFDDQIEEEDENDLNPFNGAEKLKTFDDINQIDISKMMNDNRNSHIFNPKNSLNNLNVNSSTENNFIAKSNMENSKLIRKNLSMQINNSFNLLNRSDANEQHSNFDANKINRENILLNPNLQMGNGQNVNDIQNVNQNQNIIDIPCVLGSGYKFSYENYLNQEGRKIKVEKKIFVKHEENNEIEQMLKDLRNDKKPQSANNKNIDLNNIIPIKNKISNFNDSNPCLNLDKNISCFNLNLDDKNNDSEKKENQVKSEIKIEKKFDNLTTNMLTDFNLKNYRDLPDFEVPLTYDNPQKKIKIKNFFSNTLKSSLFDIKKDNLAESIKKLELVLYYISIMKK